MVVLDENARTPPVREGQEAQKLVVVEWVAVDKKWAAGVALLVAHGGDPRKTDINGKSVLDWAPNAKIRALLQSTA